MLNCLLPDEKGYFGKFGGQYVEDVELKKEFNFIYEQFLKYKDDKEFNEELNYLLKYFVGSPSPVYLAKNLLKKRRLKSHRRS